MLPSAYLYADGRPRRMALGVRASRLSLPGPRRRRCPRRIHMLTASSGRRRSKTLGVGEWGPHLIRPRGWTYAEGGRRRITATWLELARLFDPYAEGGRRHRADHLVTSKALCRGWPSAYGFFFSSSQLVSAQNDSNIIAK